MLVGERRSRPHLVGRQAHSAVCAISGTTGSHRSAALAEREVLLRVAPDQPLQLLPHDRTCVPNWMLRAGLFSGSVAGWSKTVIAESRSRPHCCLTAQQNTAPGTHGVRVSKQFSDGFVYSDAGG